MPAANGDDQQRFALGLVFTLVAAVVASVVGFAAQRSGLAVATTTVRPRKVPRSVSTRLGDSVSATSRTSASTVRAPKRWAWRLSALPWCLRSSASGRP